MATAHKRYDVDHLKGSAKLKNKVCPRCGSIMARHEIPVKRFACGKCSYTEFL
jgi:small subunit ribosomal protein S27Ae